MTTRILVAGSGFAGMWAALSAARAVSLAGKSDDVDIAVVSPSPHLHIRPRLYETVFHEMAPELGPLFDATGVRHIGGTIERVDTARREAEVLRNDGARVIMTYDRFVLATGSSLYLPDIPGLVDHAFNVDQLDGATALDAHLRALAALPDSPARNTVVVAGGGFTGIETAAEMPARLREILGPDADVRVVVLEQANAIGPDMGPNPRPVIEEALRSLDVEVRVSTAATSIDANGVMTSDGTRIASRTVIWTAGMRASPLAAQIPGERDRLGRVHADRELRATDTPGVFVTGDVAYAATDDDGNHALMSCQHALSLGRVAGHNAAAELVGLPTHAYSQEKYVTCLDLGPWGAMYAEGWDRQVQLVRDEAKTLKQQINTQWIYPPKPDRDAAFAIANPDFVIVP